MLINYESIYYLCGFINTRHTDYDTMYRVFIPVTLLAASDILILGTTYLFMTAVPHTADNCTISEVLSRPVVSKSKWTKLSVSLRVGLEGMMQFSSSVIGELNSMFSE